MSLLKIPGLAGLLAEKEKLIAEERAAKIDPAVKAAVDAIRTKGYGQPTLNGAAAQAWAAAIGVDFTGTHLPGKGALAQAVIDTAEGLLGMAKELEDYPQGTEQEETGLLPPDAPESTPPAPVETLAPVVEEKPKRGRPKKTAEPVERAEVPPSSVAIFVDCLPPEPVEDLSPWLRDLAKRLADQYGAADVRCAGNDTPLGFGKWKGALAALCREAPLAAGTYFLDTRGSELAEVAVEAMRDRARVTRGIR